ncbi:MAG: hypothetical protein EAZ83_21265 [Oscillatoriales cyanobacterium]|nr:MAG: hypothetical protein EAZ83_21265 [Oscillatoriales cyanobacterium]
MGRYLFLSGVAVGESDSYKSFLLIQKLRIFVVWDLPMGIKVVDRSGKLLTFVRSSGLGLLVELHRSRAVTDPKDAIESGFLLSKLLSRLHLNQYHI